MVDAEARCSCANGEDGCCGGWRDVKVQMQRGCRSAQIVVCVLAGCMELFIVTYQGGVLLPRNVIDGLQPLESNKYQVEFDPGRRELVSTCEKIKVLHKIIINLH